MPPSISIVAASRNDNHGGNLLPRMQAFVTGLLEQCRRHDLRAELILVEWNPPEDRPRLAQALRWPAAGPCDVRIVEVPPAIHRRFAHAGALPVHQMIAKNAGIRRARGEFVLATNVDLLFSDELMRFLASRQLKKDCMYRIDRSDVAADLPDAPVEEQLAWCASHMLRVHAAEGTSTVNADGSFRFEDADIAASNSGVRLGAGWFAREFHGRTPYRWAGHDAEVFAEAGRFLILDASPGPCIDGPAVLAVFDGDAEIHRVTLAGRARIAIALPRLPAALRLRVQGSTRILEGEPRSLTLCVRAIEAAAEPSSTTALERLEWDARQLLGRAITSSPRYASAAPDFLHLEACGDFTLLARERWFALRGYPELELFPMNLDSLLCLAANAGGAKQCLLRPPMRAYHIEHSNSASADSSKDFFQSLRSKGVSWTEQSEVLRRGFEMARRGAPEILNGEDWGLGQDELPETQRPA